MSKYKILKILKNLMIWKRISTLDRFILKQVIEVIILGVIIFTSIIFASDTFISLVKQISMYGMPVKFAVMIILLNLPGVIVMTIPMSVLFATVMVINKMCLQSEITVMKACGISIKRIARPIFIFAAVMTLFAFFINETIVPATMSQSKYLAMYSISQRNIPDGKRNFTIKELTEGNSLKRLFYVEKCEDEKFSNISILDLSDKNNIQILEAKTGTSVPEGWLFNNASVYNISRKGKTLSTSWIEKTIADFGSDIQRQLEKKNDGSEYSFKELWTYIKNGNLEHKLKVKYTLKLWEKFALPITTFVFSLIGLPLAITPPRVRHNRGLLFCIGIIFFYYLVRAFSMSLGFNEVIIPFLAANMPNLFIGLVGYLLYWNKTEKIS